ncbi:cell division protein FtsL [Celerinatantimonas sp. MCCC 1A17872]|uniref:cell division protein FtsL n=1 Tax=Celerinatantimonas sp. MCCC 1A17872 TaxID=3177514 RepID=UPI0038C5A34F
MNQSARQPSLLGIILSDLKHFKLFWLIVVLCLVSALAIVVTTQNTRLLITQRAKLIDKQDQLNNNWRHLLIEDNALDEHNRIEQLAKQKLHMVRPQPKDEVLVTP